MLDCTDAGPGAVDADLLRERIERVRPPRPGDLVLLHTADRLAGTPAYFTDFTGLDASATELLLDAGVRVIGTDAFSLDAPFRDMIDRFTRRATTAFCGRPTSSAARARTARSNVSPTPHPAGA